MREKIGKKGIARRLFSVVLALAMIISLMPMNSITVYATGNSVTFTWTGADWRCGDSYADMVIFQIMDTFGPGDTITLVNGATIGESDDPGDPRFMLRIDLENAPDGLYGGDVSVGESRDITIPANYKIRMLSVERDRARFVCVLESTHTCENLTHQDGQAATCTEDGWKEYWICSCGKVYAANSTSGTAYDDETAWKSGDGKIAKGHSWGYNASGATLTATCSRNSAHTATLTLTASDANYSGSAAVITIGGKDAWETAGLTTPSVAYEDASGSSLSSAPTTVGTYYATITVGTATAKVQYTIEQAHGADTTKYLYDDTNHWNPCVRTDCTNTEHKYNTAVHSYDGTTHKCACGKMDPTYHEHSYATAWTTDSSYHWHVCEGTGATDDCINYTDGSKIAPHVSSGAATEEKAEVCTVCGYVITPKLQPCTPSTPATTNAENAKQYEEVAMTAGSVKDITNSGEATAEVNPYSASIVNSSSLETLVNVTPEEKAQGVNVWIEIVDATATMSAADKAAIQSVAGDNTIGMYLDASLFKKVGNGDAAKVSDVNGKIKISIVIPANLRKEGRTFEVIRVHNGVPTVIQGTYDPAIYTFTFETEQFSSYAIAFSDNSNATNASSPKTGDTNNFVLWLFVAAMGGMITYSCAKRLNRSK